MLYDLTRSLLFRLDAETSHHFALNSLNLLHKVNLLRSQNAPEQPVDLLGLRFPNPVGLSAGFDKNGDYIEPLSTLSFGFIEVGTVTPRPQPGNPRPRLFRIPESSAIINRMGFNNKGVDHLVARLQHFQDNHRTTKSRVIIGSNIGKNFDTPLENAVDDYLFCLRKVYAYSDYIVINVSSPNTKGLRSLQGESELDNLLSALKSEQQALSEQHQSLVPLLLKIAPDLAEDEIGAIAQSLLQHNIEGVIATNTTLSREGVSRFKNGGEQGGLSGGPLHSRSVAVVSQLRQMLGPDYPIIGVGGILSPTDAQTTLTAGANLVQLYTGFVYGGPRLIQAIARNQEA